MAALAFLLPNSAHADVVASPALSQAVGFPVLCYQPADWTQALATFGYPANVVGMTPAAYSGGRLVDGPTIELPAAICQQAQSLTTSAVPTVDQVHAVRVLGHEWGNATMETAMTPDPGEQQAACFGQQHFWPLMRRLGGLPVLNPSKQGRRAFTDWLRAETVMAAQTGPVTAGCWLQYRQT